MDRETFISGRFDFFLPMSRSSLGKVPNPCGSAEPALPARSSDPLVGGLERLEDTDQGIPRQTHERRLVTRAVVGTAVVARVSGVYPIFSSRFRICSSASILVWRPCCRWELVETRRLELLTLSLQRRCSSS